MWLVFSPEMAQEVSQNPPEFLFPTSNMSPCLLVRSVWWIPHSSRITDCLLHHSASHHQEEREHICSMSKTMRTQHLQFPNSHMQCLRTTDQPISRLHLIKHCIRWTQILHCAFLKHMEVHAIKPWLQDQKHKCLEYLGITQVIISHSISADIFS